MREYDVHKLIEQQDPEAKKRIWAKIESQVDLTSSQQAKPQVKRSPFKWAVVAVALIVVVTLAIALPLTVGNNGVRFCVKGDYEVVEMEQTLKEYKAEHNSEFLYVDLYGESKIISTSYSNSKKNKNDIIYFKETFTTTKENLNFWITDNKTQVDILKDFIEAHTVVDIQNIDVKFAEETNGAKASFEYNNYVYYLQLSSDNAQERLTQIIEDMLK